MGSLKKELKCKEEEWIDYDPPVVGCDISSLIDVLEANDDDDKAALEAAKLEAMDVTGTIKCCTPIRIPYETNEESAGLELSEQLGETEQIFREIEEDHGEIDPEIQSEYDRLVEMLEDIW